jgi:predicted dehydrogenase/threonine dehydrogenase-like Zn-dependent dehydrogenase
LKQIIQSLKTGKTELEDIPAPMVQEGEVLIRTTKSLVSLGTEKMLVEFGKSSLISKARQQPEKVKQVIDKIKTEGLLPTLEAVFNKLEQPLPLGYCNVGVIEAIGENVKNFQIGDRVASNGPHAEFVLVPQNLVAKIPNNVSDDEATFTVIGSIGLQSIRLLNPQLGEVVVVYGLGLIGLITAELLKANGCVVIGIDFDEAKLKIANERGIFIINPSKVDVIKTMEQYTNGNLADAVIITASAKSDEILSNSAKISRKRGKIILVGVVGLQLNRADFYEKELSFQVSCSYGPGRYDENYEAKGLDYPLPFVRWTEKRNFEAILKSIEMKNIQVNHLISNKLKLDEFYKVYENISGSKNIATIFEYPNDTILKHTVQINKADFHSSKGVVGIIGAGNFTKMTLMPILKGIKAKVKTIASLGGVTGTSLATKYNISQTTTNYETIIEDPDIDLVIITTRHDSHTKITKKALLAGKNVFVEKPLALNLTELESVANVYEQSKKSLIVGFNRRFSPHSLHIKKILPQNNTPINVIATMNAGFIPENIWIHDMEIGGGRIIGEACHLIDLISFFNDSKVIAVCANALGLNPKTNTDNVSMLLKYENGSNAVINYFANGNKSYSKERFEIYFDEKTIVLDNFKTTYLFGVNNFKNLNTKIDKGHENLFKSINEKMINGGKELISFDSIYNTTKASFAILESLKSGIWQTL